MPRWFSERHETVTDGTYLIDLVASDNISSRFVLSVFLLMLLTVVTNQIDDENDDALFYTNGI